MRKLLLCIGISILITIFIGTTFLFISSMNGYIEYVLGGYVYSQMNTEEISNNIDENKKLIENNIIINDLVEEYPEDDIWSEVGPVKDEEPLNSTIENNINIEELNDENVINENTKGEEDIFEKYKLEDKEYEYVVGKIMEEQINNFTEQTKQDKGEDFPATGYLIVTTLLYHPLLLIRVYAIAFISGIIIGSIIYLLFIKRIKGKKLIIFFILLFAIFFLLIRGLDIFDNVLFNLANGNNVTDSILSSYQYDITQMFIGYAILFSILCFICIIHQKLIARKLNKELNK